MVIVRLMRFIRQYHTSTPMRLVALWAVWWVALFMFQMVVPARFQTTAPDTMWQWSPEYTGPGWQTRHPLLADPFLNNHVAWDSEFYLAMATEGHVAASIPVDLKTNLPKTYAWLPFYGWSMGVLAAPLQDMGMRPLAAATLAGVVISALGTLMGLMALYDLALPHIGKDGAWRAVQYFLIFPTSFFLAQVYTEGLFMALSFGCLALVQRRQYMWAGALAAVAMWTRPVGVALALPLAWGLFAEWRAWRDMTRGGGDTQLNLAVQPSLTSGATKMPMMSSSPMNNVMNTAWMAIRFAVPASQNDSSYGYGVGAGLNMRHGQQAQRWLLSSAALGAFIFLFALVVLRFSEIGVNFLIVQASLLHAEPFALVQAARKWGRLMLEMVSGSPALALNSGLVLACTGLGALACLRMARRTWLLSLYSALVLFIPMTGGFPPNSMTRYVLAAPVVFMFLGWVGRRGLVDANWRLISTLLFALLTVMWTFNYWAG